MPESDDFDLRRSILDETRHLLVRDGYANVSMRKIARATGYSATSIYLYFENKDSLFYTLIGEGFDHLYAALRAGSEDLEDPVERLEGLCRAYIEFALHNPEYYEIMLQIRSDAFRRFPRDKYRRARRTLDLFAVTLRDGARQGVFVGEAPVVQAWVVWSVLHGAISLLASTRVDAGISAGSFIEATVRHAVRGCLAAPVEASNFANSDA